LIRGSEGAEQIEFFMHRLAAMAQ